MENNPRDRVATGLDPSGRSTIKPKHSAGISEILARPGGFSTTIDPDPAKGALGHR